MENTENKLVFLPKFFLNYISVISLEFSLEQSDHWIGTIYALIDLYRKYICILSGQDKIKIQIYFFPTTTGELWQNTKYTSRKVVKSFAFCICRPLGSTLTFRRSIRRDRTRGKDTKTESTFYYRRVPIYLFSKWKYDLLCPPEITKKKWNGNCSGKPISINTSFHWDLNTDSTQLLKLDCSFKNVLAVLSIKLSRSPGTEHIKNAP